MLTDMRPAANFASCDMPMIVKIMRSIVSVKMRRTDLIQMKQQLAIKL